MRLILASGSKNRQDIFKMVGLKYEVIKSDVEENSNEKDPSKYVMQLSKDKANSVASKVYDGAVIIAADSIIYMDGKIFEKPKSKEEAYQNLKQMSGKTNYAITGITIKDLYQDKEISFADITEVHFREITDEEIKWYVENDKHILERCGYSIEGKASMFVDKIVGDYNTIVGISPSKLLSKLKELGYKISDFEFKDYEV